MSEAFVPKIYCFVNGSWGGGDVSVSALSEDGEFLSGHVSSSESWAKHDIGIMSTWKHDEYQKYYPNGYELIWVDAPAKAHAGLAAAYARHLEKYPERP